MKIRTIIAATCAALAFSMAGAVSAHDGETQTVTKNVEAAIPNIPGKSLIALEVDYAPGGLAFKNRPSAVAFATWKTRSARRCSSGAAAASGLHMRDSSSSRGRGGRRIKSIMPPLTPRHPVEERSARYGSAYSLRLLLDSLGTCFVQSCTPQENATVAKLPSFSRIDSQTFAPPESQDFRDIRPRDRGGGRFILKSSVTSCRSSADAIATFSHFPSGYVRASS